MKHIKEKAKKPVAKIKNKIKLKMNTPNYEIPDGIEEIGMDMFMNSDHETIKIPDSVKIIGKMAFYN